jgi:hypothetical protein
MNNLVDKNHALVKELDSLTLEYMEALGDNWRGFPGVGDYKNWIKYGSKNRNQDLGGQYPGCIHDESGNLLKTVPLEYGKT